MNLHSHNHNQREEIEVSGSSASRATLRGHDPVALLSSVAQGSETDGVEGHASVGRRRASIDTGVQSTVKPRIAGVEPCSVSEQGSGVDGFTGLRKGGEQNAISPSGRKTSVLATADKSVEYPASEQLCACGEPGRESRTIQHSTGTTVNQSVRCDDCDEAERSTY